MPFGIGYEAPQTPGEQQGFAQQMAQLQNVMPQAMQRLQDPAAVQQAAMQLAQIMPPPSMGGQNAFAPPGMQAQAQAQPQAMNPYLQAVFNGGMQNGRPV